MSQENVEIIRRAAEVFDTGDLERWVSEFFHPDIEWRTSVEDPDAATHRGPEALKRYVEQWTVESFEGLRAEIEEYIYAGDDRVFTWVHWTGRGRSSGVEADWYLAVIYTLRDGKVERAEEYFDRGEALEAVGLSEQDARVDS
jgi:ketosteroid isomerase-like protein